MKNLTLLAACGLIALPLSACSLTTSNDTDKGTAKGTGKIAVVSTDDKCDVSVAKAPAGNLVFTVKNEGSKVTEFYLYGEDNLRIVGEVENIGPGITRQLVVRAPEGKYHTACKPGMVGQGIRADFVVQKSKDSGKITGVDQTTIDQATAQYASFVKDQASQLLPLTQQFVDAYKAMDDDKARALFPVARSHYESIEPVAESFGDLDPATDLREADLEAGQKWTGWHRIEKDLWPPASGYKALSPADRGIYGDDLLKNITTLNTRVQTLTYTVDQIGNGSKGLLDEVAASKITGEEDTWSHTDLWDFQANVDGARIAYEDLKPLLEIKDPALSKTIAANFASLQTLLDKYKKGDGFVFYDTVTEPQRKELSDAVNALAEPLSKMTGAITL
ncbi:MAG: PbrT family lead (Pb2+) uptake porter [Nocardioidaceae bacterium]|nr:PbrT family lead (Pb2+) uptake porter [Nocardioidaceae bacterium]